MPTAIRRAVLKVREGGLTVKQATAPAELKAGGFLTALAQRIKEKLCWARVAETLQAAR